MPYIDGDYTLHKREVTLKGGKVQNIYFFCKNMPPKSGEPCDLPEGYELGGYNPKTKLPYLKKVNK